MRFKADAVAVNERRCGKHVSWLMGGMSVISLGSRMFTL